jgi:hypothetical protein
VASVVNNQARTQDRIVRMRKPGKSTAYLRFHVPQARLYARLRWAEQVHFASSPCYNGAGAREGGKNRWSCHPMSKSHIWFLFAATLVLFAGTPKAVADSASLTDGIKWLESESHRLIRTGRRTMKDGTAAFPPQVGIGYEAFWLRDFVYTLEVGCSSGVCEQTAPAWIASDSTAGRSTSPAMAPWARIPWRTDRSSL